MNDFPMSFLHLPLEIKNLNLKPPGVVHIIRFLNHSYNGNFRWIPKFFDGAGGLRPHFFDLCRPVMPDNSTCADAKNLGRFIEDYRCSRTDYPQRIYRTFPSGHATVSSFAVMYTIAFLEAKVRNANLQTLKQAAQYVFLLYGKFWGKFFWVFNINKLIVFLSS